MFVKHYGVYESDRRYSMEIYSVALKNGLLEIPCETITVDSVVPGSVFSRSADRRWSMRAARYMAYPWAVLRSQADVHHILDHGYAHLIGALGRGGTLCTVHDIIPVLAWKGLLAGVSNRKKPHLALFSLRKLRYFDRVIAVSESTKLDVVTNFDVPPDRVHVIPPGCSPAFKQLPYNDVRSFEQRFSLERVSGERRILLSGAAFYKNHETAMAVFAALCRRYDGPMTLLKSGETYAGFDSLARRFHIVDRVRQIQVPLTEMPALYNSVDCLLFPSIYEGFGLPVIEALACGTPVVTSNVASLPEAGGPAALACDPLNVDELARAVESVLFDDAVREKLMSAARDWVPRFTWAETARQTLAVYRSVLNEAGAG